MHLLYKYCTLKKVLLTFGGVGGVPVTMFSDATAKEKSKREWEFVPSDESKLIDLRKGSCRGGKNESYEKLIVQQDSSRREETAAIGLRYGKVYMLGNQPPKSAYFSGVEFFTKGDNQDCWKKETSKKVKDSDAGYTKEDWFLVAIVDFKQKRVAIGIRQWKDINKDRNGETGLTIDRINNVFRGEGGDEETILMNNQRTRRWSEWSRVGPNFLQYYGCLVMIGEKEYALGAKCDSFKEEGSLLPENQDGRLLGKGQRGEKLAIVMPVGRLEFKDGKLRRKNKTLKHLN